MNARPEEARLRELFELQAGGLTVADPPSLGAIAGQVDPDRSGRGMSGASRLMLAAAAVAIVTVGLVAIGAARSGDTDLAPSGTADLADESGATTALPGVLPIDGDDGPSVASSSVVPRPDGGVQNFLITGADNNACVDPDSPYAGGFGGREVIGERSDTIMMWRVDPATYEVSVLSFPRDLWVTIAGRSNKQRINSAYVPDNPQLLIDTIYENFGISTDHFIQIDFCGFKRLVDAVGGVSVPFATPVRDLATGLDVPEAGCYTFSGDHALAYVRSRKFESYTPADGWVIDPTSDLGRISRQQDFLRRTLAALLDRGAFDPDVAGGLIETLHDHVVTDPSLTPRRMLEFASVMSKVEPAAITTFQVPAEAVAIQGNSVLIPHLDSAASQAVLALFQGETTSTGVPVTTGTAASSAPGASTTVEPTPTQVGVVPDATACSLAS